MRFNTDIVMKRNKWKQIFQPQHALWPTISNYLFIFKSITYCTTFNKGNSHYRIITNIIIQIELSVKFGSPHCGDDIEWVDNRSLRNNMNISCTAPLGELNVWHMLLVLCNGEEILWKHIEINFKWRYYFISQSWRMNGVLEVLLTKWQ